MADLTSYEIDILCQIYYDLNGLIDDTQKQFCTIFNKSIPPSAEQIHNLTTENLIRQFLTKSIYPMKLNNNNFYVREMNKKYGQDNRPYKKIPLKNTNQYNIDTVNYSLLMKSNKLQFNDYNNFPYWIGIYDEMTDKIRQERCELKENMKLIDPVENNIIHKIIMCGEMDFDLNGNVYKNNYRICGKNIDKYIDKRSPEIDKNHITIWCGITSKNIIGPYFLENNKFCNVVDNNIKTYNDLDCNIDWWLQHPNCISKANKIIGNSININDFFLYLPHNYINWPDCSPDLSALNFFLWGYLKDKVYKKNPKTLVELKKYIVYEINKISSTLLKSVMKSIIYRTRLCEINNGNYMRDICILPK